MKNVDDEDQMVLAMKAIKQANPKVATYFYMNSFKDRPEMTRMVNYNNIQIGSYTIKMATL